MAVKLAAELLVLCMICALWGASAGAASPCAPGLSPDQPITIDQLDGTTRYDFAHSLDEIAALRTATGQPVRQARSDHTLGTTEVHFRSGYGLNYVLAPLPDGRFCARLTGAQVTFGFESITVHVAREFPPGSCLHAAILEHEEGHVAISRQVYAITLARLSYTLEQARRDEFAVEVSSEAAAGETLRSRLSGIVDRFTTELLTEQASRNQQHDGPQSRQLLALRCPGDRLPDALARPVR